jgi:uncharacterized membrane protein YkvA (DUF1232 family)
LIVAIALVPWGLLIVLIALYTAGVIAFVLAGRRTDARALAGFVPDCARMMKRLMADPATTRGEWLVLVLLVAYLASPIDLVPDFIPVAGQLDDAIIVALALRWLIGRRGVDAIRASWPGPEPSLRMILAAVGRRGPDAEPRHYP